MSKPNPDPDGARFDDCVAEAGRADAGRHRWLFRRDADAPEWIMPWPVLEPSGPGTVAPSVTLDLAPDPLAEGAHRRTSGRSWTAQRFWCQASSIPASPATLLRVLAECRRCRHRSVCSPFDPPLQVQVGQDRF